MNSAENLPLIYLRLVLTTLFWGGTFIAGRLLANQVSPLCAAFWRFLIAALTLWFIVLLSRTPLPRPTMRQATIVLLLGSTGVFAYNALFFTGLTHIGAGRAALIIATTPLAIAVASAALYREPLGKRRLFGILLSLFGAILVISNGHPTAIFSGGFGIGEAALLGCVLSWTAYTLFGRALLVTLPPLVAVFYSAVAGTVLLLGAALADGLIGSAGSIGPLSWLCLGYLGILGTAVGFSWYYRGIHAIGPARAGVFINLVPVFALLLSWLLLSESLKISVLTGGLLVLAGVYITNRRRLGRQTNRPSSP